MHNISAEDQAQVDLYRSLLYIKRLEIDPLTQERRLVTKLTPISRAYAASKLAYEAAEQHYNALRQTGRLSPESQAVLDAAVQTALTNWIIKGYKNEVEHMEAFIAQATDTTLRQLDAASRPEH